jgi:hypothetical protein
MYTNDATAKFVKELNGASIDVENLVYFPKSIEVIVMKPDFFYFLNISIICTFL